MNRWWQWGMAAILVAGPVWAGSGSYNREIRYPTRFEVRPGANGVAIVPSEFTTRETGPRLEVKQVGIARNVLVDGKPGVRLQLQDGRTLITRTGRRVKLDGVVYRTAGWRDGKYMLVSTADSQRTIAFGIPQ